MCEGLREEPFVVSRVYPRTTSRRRIDLLWPSSSYMTVLEQGLDERHFARPHRDVDYGTAGHLLGSAIPYLPAAGKSGYGGSPAADAAARAALWPCMLEFMRGLRGE
jgi:hypothetical protein